MSGRRAPLQNNPNAANSPFRAVAAAAAQKQKRSYANIQREDSYGQPPPAKKQMLESRPTLRTPPRPQPSHIEGRVFTRKSNPQPTEFERKCVAASRERPIQKTAPQRVIKGEQSAEENEETMKSWRKHTRKSFPGFVFYFESVPADLHLKCAKQVISLGAREEKFFSNAVTHVVTTRHIPPAHITSSAISSSTNNSQSQDSHASQSQNGLSQTINPSLLDRSSESTNGSLGVKGKFTFEAPMNRKIITQGRDVEIRRQQTRNSDVLYKARDLGMKIWALEKLQRMMSVMFEDDSGNQPGHVHNTRGNLVSVTAQVPKADLSQLLRNERINGPSDRDLTVAAKELIIFKGPYIYIRDIDEKQRPIMVREYTKVANKHDGDWPQFRSVANGKCPFVPEVDTTRRDAENELQRQQEKEKALVPRTRAAAAFEASCMQPPKSVISKRVLSEMGDSSNRSATVSTNQTNPFNSGRNQFPHRSGNDSSSKGQQNAFVSRAGNARHFAGEPVASGIQPSNITSAIRSQAISSTAAQPGVKTGTNKEIYGLQRKVLEKNSGPASYGQASSHRMTDISRGAREDMANRPAKRKLGPIVEDVDPSEAEEKARKAEVARKTKAVQQRKIEQREAKPGYCENCQDKFEDFEEHVLSRKHRKFAEKAENWKELDALLETLAQPARQYD